MQRTGTRLQVWEGKAEKTTGGLTKEQLFQTQNGTIKSRAASDAAGRRQARFRELEELRMREERRAEEDRARQLPYDEYYANLWTWLPCVDPRYNEEDPAEDRWILE